MTARRLIAALATTLALAAPGAALAQSAGDDQYEDPFAGETTPEPEPAPTLEPAPAAPAAPQPEPEPAPAPVTRAEAAAAEELPATGVETTLVALLGAGMLLTGTGVRLRLRAGD